MPHEVRRVVGGGIVLGTAVDESAAVGPIEVEMSAFKHCLPDDRAEGICTDDYFMPLITFRRTDSSHPRAPLASEIGRTFTMIAHDGRHCVVRADEIVFLHRSHAYLFGLHRLGLDPDELLQAQWENGRQDAVVVARTSVLSGNCGESPGWAMP